MSLRLLLATVLVLTARASGLAQTTQPQAPALRWGVRLGLGQGRLTYGDSRREYSQTYLSPTGGLILSRYQPALRASFHAEALYEGRTVRTTFTRAAASGSAGYHDQTGTSHQLVVPVYVRTGAPGSLVHLLAGAGASLHLGSSGLAADAAYYPRRAAAMGLLGVEVRLPPVRGNETALGLHLRVPFTPAYAYGVSDAYTQSGQVIDYESRKTSYAPWLGLTLATYFHSAARL